MLLGVALGDALGGPWEFVNSGGLRCDGKGFLRPAELGYRWAEEVGNAFKPIQWGPYHAVGPFFSEVGQVTDDTEMTIALARSLVNTKRFDADNVALSYIDWAGSKGRMMGRNTKALFAGIKSTGVRALATYRKRWAKSYGSETLQADWTQSNGCLMRASPLAVFRSAEPATKDCQISNPHPLCVASCRFYHAWLRAVLLGQAPTDAAVAVRERTLAVCASTPGSWDEMVCLAVRRALGGEVADGKKGWCLSSLTRAVAAHMAASQPGGPTGADYIFAVVRECVRMGGDTDTNAAIAGAVAGAYVGSEREASAFEERPVLCTILSCDTSKGQLQRPERFWAREVLGLATGLAALWES